MRIGIVTQPLHHNYGGLLQNFALQQVLRDNGHEPITLDWDGFNAPRWRIIASRIKWWLLVHLKLAPEPNYCPNEEEFKVIRQNTNRFVDKYITRTKVLHSSVEFLQETEIRQLQALIAGSDQVWRPCYARGHILDMFFDFAKNLDIKRIAYAASFGTDQWEITPEDTPVCSSLAKKFNLITTRESSGVYLCKMYLGVEATHVLDPTMLHDKSVYEKIVTEMNTPKSKGNLFHYILDPSAEKTAFINDIAKEKGLTPFTVMPTYQDENRKKRNVKNEIDKCVFPGIEQWLRGFMDAEMVICDSFHGCVFSIIFNKPFWVIANASRGNARFDSLLTTFGLQDRLISLDEVRGYRFFEPQALSKPAELERTVNDIDKPIDWSKVNQIMLERRGFSKTLLLNALNT